MTGLAITGFGVLSAAGVGPEPLAAAVRDRVTLRRDVTGLYSQPLPAATAPALVDFDVRSYLGRKGTSSLDRVTSLTLVAGGLLLEDCTLPVNELGRDRVGVVLGTTVGSFKSTCDFSGETLVSAKPYLVNPVLFPNTVMNCAAGRLAIRYGLRGANATLAVGQLGLIAVVKYVRNIMRRGHSDAVIAGASEEFTPHAAWLAHLAPAGRLTAGEGSAMFAVERAETVRADGRPVDAEILAVATSFGSCGDAEPLARCIRKVLEDSGIRGADVATLATSEYGEDDESQTRVVHAVADASGADRLVLKPLVGECNAASTALHAAAVLARHRADPSRDGEITMITARSIDGGAGTALLRGWSRGGGNHR